MKINLRDLILGGQDGLVNVLGIMLGLFAAHADERMIIIAGLAAGVSEATSMGAVAFTSARADKKRIETEGEGSFFSDSIVVGVSALICAGLPILPFLFLPALSAVVVSLILSCAVLFSFGSARTYNMGKSRIKSGFEVLLIGLVSALLGFLVGLLLRV